MMLMMRGFCCCQAVLGPGLVANDAHDAQLLLLPSVFGARAGAMLLVTRLLLLPRGLGARAGANDAHDVRLLLLPSSFGARAGRK